MTRNATKKAAPAKKAAAKKPAPKAADPLADVRADTPNPELTDLDRDEPCRFCGRDAVARLTANGRPVCETHKSRAEALEQETESL